jgi:hypothetical protein
VAALAVAVFLTSGSGFAVVGDSVSQDAREELTARGADVYANGGVDIVTGRAAIRRLSREGRRRAVIELGLMDVGFWSSADDLRRRVRATMRDDIDGIGCVIWLDLPTRARRGQPQWPERAAGFNTMLIEEGERFGVHIARWSVFSRRHPDWFRADRIHPNRRGERGFAKYVADRVDHFC